MSASSSVKGKFGRGSAIAMTFFLTSSMKPSASPSLLKTQARATDPLTLPETPPPTFVLSSPALMPTSVPKFRPALALALIVTLVVPSARTSLTPSTPPPNSTQPTLIEPAMPRCDELRTHSESGGAFPAPHSGPFAAARGAVLAGDEADRLVDPAGHLAAGAAGHEHGHDRDEQQQAAEILGARSGRRDA